MEVEDWIDGINHPEWGREQVCLVLFESLSLYGLDTDAQIGVWSQ